MGSALISDCGKYRTRLTRHISDDVNKNYVTFIMLNPSTADANKDDATIRKCCGFAKILGFSFLNVVNLFDFRATHPYDLKKTNFPSSENNLPNILAAAKYSDMVICAWGTNGSFNGQDKKVLSELKEAGIKLHALEITKDGFPKHPLYISYSKKPIPFPP